MSDRNERKKGEPWEVMNESSCIWLITGGGRSGKSSYAEKLAAERLATEGLAAEGLPGAKRGLLPSQAPACRDTESVGNYRPGVLYIATGVAMDDEMKERIARHRAARPADWITWEGYRGFAGIESEFQDDEFEVILLDCLAGLLMGILFEEAPEADDCTMEQFEAVERMSIHEVDTLCNYAKKNDKDLIVVTNEIGMGIIPETLYSRLYRDALGRINVHAAGAADKVILMVAGIPVVLK